MTYFVWGLFLGVGIVLGWWSRGRRIRAVYSARSRPRLRPASKVLRGGSPFRVVTADGTVCYEGSSGGDARRTIEKLRVGGVEWTAARDGEPWDWGPR